MFQETDSTLNWFAVKVRSNHERVTSRCLSGKGYEVFLPESGGEKSSLSTRSANPLFPGYLFCRFNVNRRLPVLTAPGVVHIVGLGRTPTPVSEEEIGSLRIAAEAGLPLKAGDVYTAGDKVHIERGPLLGAAGVVAGSERKRLVLWITLLQKSVSVELPPD